VLDGNQLDDFANTARIRLRIKRGGVAAGPLTDSSTMVAAFSLRIFPHIAQILAEFTKHGSRPVIIEPAARRTATKSRRKVTNSLRAADHGVSVSATAIE
jgi:uncharacterized protein (DUF3084 family)